MLARLTQDRQSLASFLIVALGSQVIYSLVSLRSVLYGPYRDFFGLTNAQLGHLLSLTGLVATVTYVLGGWIQDRFALRKVLSLNMLLAGLCGVVMASKPSYLALLLIFGAFGLFTDGLFWGGVLKMVRALASDQRQGTAFGTLELIRGLTELGINALGILLFSLLGQRLLGIQVALGINATLIVVMALITWRYLPDVIDSSSKRGSERNRRAWQQLLAVLRAPEVWLVGLEASGIYVIYIGLQYFLPFLQDVFQLPVLYAAVFGVLNTSATRMIASPLAGVIGDWKFGSSTRFIRALLAVVILFLVVLMLLPWRPSYMLPCICMLSLVSVACFMMRGIYYAPIGELGIPKESCGSAMSVASLIGYSPIFWAYGLYGSIIDQRGAAGYPRIFAIILGSATIGFVASVILCRMVQKRRIQSSPTRDDSAAGNMQ